LIVQVDKIGKENVGILSRKVPPLSLPRLPSVTLLLSTVIGQSNLYYATPALQNHALSVVNGVISSVESEVEEIYLCSNCNMHVSNDMMESRQAPLNLDIYCVQCGASNMKVHKQATLLVEVQPHQFKQRLQVLLGATTLQRLLRNVSAHDRARYLLQTSMLRSVLIDKTIDVPCIVSNPRLADNVLGRIIWKTVETTNYKLQTFM
jgi:hypothetical protein